MGVRARRKPTFSTLPCLFVVVLLSLTVGAARAQEVVTLREAIDLALERNYAVQIARNVVKIAENDYSRGNAGFLPTLDLSAGYNGTLANTDQAFLGGNAQNVRGAHTTRRTAAATARWTLFDGMARFATYDRLEVQLAQEAVRAELAAENILADVVTTYFDIARQQQQLRVFEEGVSISEERLGIAELRRDLGSASELEVRQARLDLNADRAALLRQQIALDNTRADFNLLLARPGSLNFVVADSIILAQAVDPEALLQAAVAHNPSLRIAEQARAISSLEMREVRAERFPTVNLTSGYAYSSVDAESGFLLSSRSNDFTYGLAVTFPLFDAFNRRRRTRNATVRLRNAELFIEEARTLLATDVARFYQTYANSRALIALEEENLSLARQNVEIALERFRLGTITSVELREVQETLILAQSRLLTAAFEAKRAETELLRLSGRLAAPE